MTTGNNGSDKFKNGGSSNSHDANPPTGVPSPGLGGGGAEVGSASSSQGQQAPVPPPTNLAGQQTPQPPPPPENEPPTDDQPGEGGPIGGVDPVMDQGWLPKKYNK
jgi:hypothetical protein